ncbi:hypothetical protein T06_7689, partial [Trichinella sp. T6]
MTESSESRYYNGSGKIINLRIGSMRVQCTVHEIPLSRVHMKLQWLLWNSKTFLHCIKFCVRQFRVNLCNAVYFEAEEKTCLHLLLNATQALYEYSESKKETVHFIEKCVEVEEQQEYQDGSAINRIQPDETSISSPSRPISSTTHNVREQELDFFHYVAAENVKERYVKLYEFFEICEVQLLNIDIIRNAFAIEIPRKIYSLNRCLHICRRHTSCIAILFSQLHHQCKKVFKGRSRNSILVHANETVVALKECYKDMTESSESRYYNGSGKIINLRIGSMRVQCTVHEIPLSRVHMKLQWLLWDSKTFLHCIKFCVRQFRVNLCNAVYFEAEEKTCLHLLLNATQALYEYSESKEETAHFIEKCVEVEEQQEYQDGSAINRIQPDETSISSPSRPISSTTHNVREQELDFFHYVAAENVKERYVKLYEFFEICEVQLLNIDIIRNAFAIEIPRKIYSLNRCLHICRRHTSCIAILFSQLHHQCKKVFKGRSRNSILVHANETVVALKECYKGKNFILSSF